jgi:hypothetical protein
MPSLLVPWILLLLAIAVTVYFVIKMRSTADVDDSASMPAGSRRILTGYLLAFGVSLVYILVSLISVDFPETAVVPEIPISAASTSPTPTSTPTPSQSAAASPTSPVPVLIRVLPQCTVGSPPTVAMTVYGRNFTEKSKVRFNMRPVAIEYVSDNLITAPLQPADLVGVGSITVDVVNADNIQSNGITVPVHKPKVPLNVFGWHPWITREVQLLLLVIFAGALGSYLHAIMSLADFIGNRTLTASWFWWYVTRPFLGMAMALVFYAVLRGGFLAGSPADAKVVNPFGVLAIGALVGMFSDKAAQKLGDIFDVVFKTAVQRTDKLGADLPLIDRLEPATVLSGGTSPLEIKIIGDHLGKVSTVRVNSDDRKPDSVGEKEITFTLKPEDIATPRQIKITAVNPDGGASTAATLYVSDLTITTGNPLPDAKAETDYQAPAITASGGTLPYKWSAVDAPKWLRIDDTGTLKGKPGKGDVKDNKVTVKIVDKEGASASKVFDLKVTA